MSQIPHWTDRSQSPTHRRRRQFRSLRSGLIALGVTDETVIERALTVVEPHLGTWANQADAPGGVQYWIPPSAGYVAIGDSDWELATNGRVYAYVYPNRVRFEDGTTRRIG